MTIIHIQKRENPFVQIDKRGLEDTRLSYKARGVLAYLLSKPPDWRVMVKDLVNRSDKDGESAVRSALKELEACGYMEKIQLHKDDGTFAPIEYNVYEIPLGGFPHTVKPHVDKPLADNRSYTNNDETDNELTNIGTAQNSEEIGDEENTSVNQDQPVAVSNENGPDGAEGGTVGEKSEGTMGGGLQGVVVKGRRPQLSNEEIAASIPEDCVVKMPPVNERKIKVRLKGGDEDAQERILHRSGRVYSETGGRGGKGGEGIRSGRGNSAADPGADNKARKRPPWVNAPLPPNSEGGRYLQSRCGWWKGFVDKEQQREFQSLERQLTLTKFLPLIDGLLEEGEYHHDVAESVIERAKTAETPTETEEENEWLYLPETPDIPTNEWLEW